MKSGSESLDPYSCGVCEEIKYLDFAEVERKHGRKICILVFGSFPTLSSEEVATSDNGERMRIPEKFRNCKSISS